MTEEIESNAARDAYHAWHKLHEVDAEADSSWHQF